MGWQESPMLNFSQRGICLQNLFDCPSPRKYFVSSSDISANTSYTSVCFNHISNEVSNVCIWTFLFWHWNQCFFSQSTRTSFFYCLHYCDFIQKIKLSEKNEVTTYLALLVHLILRYYRCCSYYCCCSYFCSSYTTANTTTAMSINRKLKCGTQYSWGAT